MGDQDEFVKGPGGRAFSRRDFLVGGGLGLVLGAAGSSLVDISFDVLEKWGEGNSVKSSDNDQMFVGTKYLCLLPDNGYEGNSYGLYNGMMLGFETINSDTGLIVGSPQARPMISKYWDQSTIRDKAVLDHLLGHRELVPNSEKATLIPQFRVEGDDWSNYFSVSGSQGIFEGRHSNLLAVESPDDMRDVIYVDKDRDGTVNALLYYNDGDEKETVESLDFAGSRMRQNQVTEERDRILRAVAEYGIDSP